jgi:hypothetical protein
MKGEDERRNRKRQLRDKKGGQPVERWGGGGERQLTEGGGEVEGGGGGWLASPVYASYTPYVGSSIRCHQQLSSQMVSPFGEGGNHPTSLPTSQYRKKNTATMHCKDDPMYVFPKMKLRGLVPSSHGHVSAFLEIFVSNFWYSVFAVWKNLENNALSSLHKLF